MRRSARAMPACVEDLAPLDEVVSGGGMRTMVGLASEIIPDEQVA